MTLSAGTRLGPYEILAAVGTGGMGEVYRARDSRLEREVAVKVVPESVAKDPGVLARFEREAKAVAALSHPNILAIHDFGKDQDVYFAVMELLHGETLGSRIARSALPWRKACEIASAVADGLAAAHTKGILHRDLKPDNIFLTSDGHVKILDFGLARIKARPAPEDAATTFTDVQTRPMTLKTEAGAVMGTVGYMSPEQVRGRQPDAPGDIFSLGCVLYEMVAGIRPFARESVAECMAAILHQDPPPLDTAHVPPELERLIARCLEKKPEERFQSARDLAFALRAMATASGPMKESATDPALAGRVPRRRLRPAAWLGIVAAAAALALGWAGWRHFSAQRIESLAVLPIVNANANPELEYLSDGITEGLINKLSQLPGVGVMSRSSVFRFKGRDVDPLAAGQQLKVQAVLVGRLAQKGEDVQLGMELVDTSNGRQIWGEQYKRRMSDIQSLHEEIALSVSDRLHLGLSGEEKQRIAGRGAANAEAYRLYLQGRYQWNKRTLEGMQQSIELFEQAIAKDSGYALAHAGLADAYAVLAQYNVLPAREVMPRAKLAAAQALRLDEKLAEAHASLGWVKLAHDWAWPDAEREFQRSIQLNPNYAPAHQWYGEYLLVTGAPDKALAEARQAVDLEPASPVMQQALGLVLYQAGRYAEAAAQGRKTIGLDPSFAGAHVLLGRTLLRSAATADAIGEFQKALELSEGNSNELAALGYAYAVSGNRSEATKVLAELDERSRQTYVQPVWLAVIYAALGDRNRAFEYLQKGASDRSGWLVYLKVDPAFQPLSSDARFNELVRTVGLP
jgi:serine/threonine-protein kinase